MKLFLAFIIAALLFCTACSSGTELQQSDTLAAGETPAKADAADDLSPNIPAADYSGYDFRVYTTDIQKNETAYHEIYSEEENGEPVNDAVYRRNSVISDKYNISISGLFYGLFDYANFIKAVTANEDAYDIVMPNIASAMNFAASGYLQEIDKFPYMDFSKPWWLENSVTETSILKKSFLAVGDINLASYESTPVIFFNKKMAEAYEIKGLYSIVDTGNWTYDKMLEYCTSVGTDLDGNGVLDGNDSYGLALNSFSVFTMTYGGDFRIITKDKDDVPQISFSEGFVSFLQRHIGEVASNESILNGDTIADGDILKGVEIRKTAFQENRVLFYNEMLTMATMLRGMETDFGVLPMPKSSENQDRYYSFFHKTNSSTVTVPVTNTDPDRTGRITEDLLYQSYLLVRPAYFNTTVANKLMRDEDSERMLDLILGNIIFDVALEPGVLDDIRPLFNKANEDIVSKLESNRGKYEKALLKYTEALVET